MASLETDKSGNKTIRVLCADGRRKRIPLGKIALKLARTIRTQINELESHRAAAVALPVSLAKWTDEIGDELHAQIVETGLLQPRAKTATIHLGAACDAFLAKRADIKGGSRLAIEYALRNLRSFFGDMKPLADITAACANDFARHLRASGQAPATTSRRLRTCRSFFADAVKRRLLVENPFADIRGGSQKNPSRQRFIDRETIHRVIDAAPDSEWRLLISLARFGGVRVPSEAVDLKWSDIDWERNRIRIRSPKTEHHVGHESREIPLFPELLTPLLDRRDITDAQCEYVFDRLRRDAAKTETGWKAINLRTQFGRIIKKAKVDPWPRLWVNLRSSCETELVQSFPAHVVASWLGHTPEVAAAHYLQTLESHFEDAARCSDEFASIRDRAVSRAQTGHTVAILGNLESSTDWTGNEETPEKQGFCELVTVAEESKSCPMRIRTSTK